MNVERIRRDLCLALEAFYEGGTHTFLDVFSETPLAAIAAFAARPEVFGVLDAKLIGINRRRLHARAIALARQLIE